VLRHDHVGNEDIDEPELKCRDPFFAAADRNNPAADLRLHLDHVGAQNFVILRDPYNHRSEPRSDS
jgi:hypothetical protein